MKSEQNLTITLETIITDRQRSVNRYSLINVVRHLSFQLLSVYQISFSESTFIIISVPFLFSRCLSQQGFSFLFCYPRRKFNTQYTYQLCVSMLVSVLDDNKFAIPYYSTVVYSFYSFSSYCSLALFRLRQVGVSIGGGVFAECVK